MRVSKWGQNCHFCMHYPFNMSICSHQHIAWDLLVPPRVDLVSDIKSSEGAGISWVCARREERETRRMGLGWQTHKDYQIQTDTQTHTQTCAFFDTHTHRPSRSESCQLSDVLSSDYKPPVFLSSPCKHSKLFSFFPPSFSLTPSLTPANKLMF